MADGIFDPKLVQLLNCPKCNFASKRIGRFISHISMDHNDEYVKITIYKCSACNLISTHRTLLDDHVSCDHPDSIVPAVTETLFSLQINSDKENRNLEKNSASINSHKLAENVLPKCDVATLTTQFGKSIDCCTQTNMIEKICQPNEQAIVDSVSDVKKEPVLNPCEYTTDGLQILKVFLPKRSGNNLLLQSYPNDHCMQPLYNTATQNLSPAINYLPHADQSSIQHPLSDVNELQMMGTPITDLPPGPTHVLYNIPNILQPSPNMQTSSNSGQQLSSEQGRLPQLSHVNPPFLHTMEISNARPQTYQEAHSNQSSNGSTLAGGCRILNMAHISTLLNNGIPLNAIATNSNMAVTKNSGAFFLVSAESSTSRNTAVAQRTTSLITPSQNSPSGSNTTIHYLPHNASSRDVQSSQNISSSTISNSAPQDLLQTFVTSRNSALSQAASEKSCSNPAIHNLFKKNDTVNNRSNPSQIISATDNNCQPGIILEDRNRSIPINGTQNVPNYSDPISMDSCNNTTDENSLSLSLDHRSDIRKIILYEARKRGWQSVSSDEMTKIMENYFDLAKKSRPDWLTSAVINDVMRINGTNNGNTTHQTSYESTESTSLNEQTGSVFGNHSNTKEMIKHNDFSPLLRPLLNSKKNQTNPVSTHVVNSKSHGTSVELPQHSKDTNSKSMSGSSLATFSSNLEEVISDVVNNGQGHFTLKPTRLATSRDNSIPLPIISNFTSVNPHFQIGDHRVKNDSRIINSETNISKTLDSARNSDITPLMKPHDIIISTVISLSSAESEVPTDEDIDPDFVCEIIDELPSPTVLNSQLFSASKVKPLVTPKDNAVENSTEHLPCSNNKATLLNCEGNNVINVFSNLKRKSTENVSSVVHSPSLIQQKSANLKSPPTSKINSLSKEKWHSQLASVLHRKLSPKVKCAREDILKKTGKGSFFRCSYCSRYFKSSGLLASHLRDCHRSFLIDDVPRIKKRRLNTPDLTTFSSESKKAPCDLSNNAETIFFPEIEKDFGCILNQCIICRAVLPDINAFQQHQRIAHTYSQVDLESSGLKLHRLPCPLFFNSYCPSKSQASPSCPLCPTPQWESWEDFASHAVSRHQLEPSVLLQLTFSEQFDGENGHDSTDVLMPPPVPVHQTSHLKIKLTV